MLGERQCDIKAEQAAQRLRDLPRFSLKPRSSYFAGSSYVPRMILSKSQLSFVVNEIPHPLDAHLLFQNPIPQ